MGPYIILRSNILHVLRVEPEVYLNTSWCRRNRLQIQTILYFVFSLILLKLTDEFRKILYALHCETTRLWIYFCNILYFLKLQIKSVKKENKSLIIVYVIDQTKFIANFMEFIDKWQNIIMFAIISCSSMTII